MRLAAAYEEPSSYGSLAETTASRPRTRYQTAQREKKARSRNATRRAQGDSKSQDVGSSVAQFSEMAMDRFAQAGVVLRVHSELLGEVVLFASDNAEISEDETRPVYRAAELGKLLLLGTEPADLMTLHTAKKATVGVEAS